MEQSQMNTDTIDNRIPGDVNSPFPIDETTPARTSGKDVVDQEIKPSPVKTDTIDSRIPGDLNSSLLNDKTTPARTSGKDVVDQDIKPSPVKTDTIDTRIPGDLNSSFPIDIAVVTTEGVDVLIVCDRDNCLKSFYKDKDVIQREKLEEVKCPMSVANLEENRLVVTVPLAINIVVVTAGRLLHLVSSFRTRKSYAGITVLSPSTLAVSSSDPPAVDIVDLSGSVLKTLPTDQGVLKDPSCLATTLEGNILVSDSEARIVLCLDPTGDVVFRFSRTDTFILDIPLGLAVLPSGEVLLADSGLRCVIQLTGSGQFVKKLLTSVDGISRPHSICVDRQRKLYVCDWFEEEVGVYSLEHGCSGSQGGVGS